MDNMIVDENTGLNCLSDESKSRFLRQIWNCYSYPMCLAKMSFDDLGKPVDYIILDINPAYEKAFGLTKDQAINKRVTELFPRYASKWIEKCGDAVCLGKNLLSVEPTPNPCLWYEVQVIPLGSGDQFITMVQKTFIKNEENIGVVNNPTSNKIVNEALIEQVELMNVLMDYNPSLIFLKDERGRYVYLNRTYEQQFVGSKDWFGKTDFDFWSKESAELFRANDLAVLEAGNATQYLEDSKDLAGARYCWLNYKFPYIDSKNNRYTGGISIDVTKRILAEEALRKAEEELAHYAEELKVREEEALELIDGFTEGSWIVDRIAGTIRCSEKWSKRIGLDQVREEERLSYTHSLTLIEDTVDGNSIEYCMEMGLTRFDLEYRVKTIDSGYIWTQNKGKIVYDSKGTAIKVFAATIDISERKRAEETLRESEEKYRTLITFTNQGFAICQLIRDESGNAVDYRYLEINPSMERILGLKNVVCKTRNEIFPDRIGTEMPFYARIDVTSAPVVRQDYKSIDGRWYDVSSYSRDVDQFVVFFDDITERKQAEEKVRDAAQLIEYHNHKLNTIIQSLPHGLVIYDINANPIFYNEQALKGYANAIEKKDIPFAQRVQAMGPMHKDGGSAATEEMPIKRALKGEVVRDLEMCYTSRSGERVWVSSTTAPIINGDGEINEAVATYVDITERKHIEEALRNSEQRLRLATQSAEMYTWELDISTGEIKFSGDVKSIVGFTYTEHDDILSHIDRYTVPEDGVRHKEALQRTMKGGGDLHAVNRVINPETGEIVWIETHATLIRSSGGSPQRVVGIARNITESKRTEEALRLSEQKALALVCELEKADKNKNQFIGVLSHELRNPLAAISAGVQMLYITQDENQTAKTKEIINRQMNQLCILVDDLLELTRITQNKIKLKKEHIYLGETVKNAVDDMRLAYEKKGINLKTRIQVKPILLSADPVRVTQVIGNILMNALKFTQENGEVWVALRTEENNAVIRIKDNGIGISPELLPRLFTPFTQADNSLDRSSGGLGLGLSIVKGIMDLHEGSVKAYSKGLGKGSTFEIRLPLTTEGNLVTENRASDISGKKTLKLLIIEDNRDFADLLSAMLSTIICHVDIASDGIEGIKLAKQIRPDVIFCDIGLPGMNGYDVAKNIRIDDSIKDTRLIALTGYAGEEDTELILQAGFDKHLAKPVDFTTLKTVL